MLHTSWTKIKFATIFIISSEAKELLKQLAISTKHSGPGTHNAYVALRNCRGDD